MNIIFFIVQPSGQGSYLSDDRRVNRVVQTSASELIDVRKRCLTTAPERTLTLIELSGLRGSAHHPSPSPATASTTQCKSMPLTLYSVLWEDTSEGYALQISFSRVLYFFEVQSQSFDFAVSLAWCRLCRLDDACYEIAKVVENALNQRLGGDLLALKIICICKRIVQILKWFWIVVQCRRTGQEKRKKCKLFRIRIPWNRRSRIWPMTDVLWKQARLEWRSLSLQPVAIRKSCSSNHFETSVVMELLTSNILLHCRQHLNSAEEIPNVLYNG